MTTLDVLLAWLRRAWLPCLWVGTTPAQAALHFEAEPPALVRFVEAAAAALLRCHDPTGPDGEGNALGPAHATGPLLAWLWLRRDEHSRDILRRECAAGARDAGAAGWIVLHHYWYLRATHDAATIRAHAPVLSACAAQLTAEATEGLDSQGGTFEDDVLRLHAVACCGGLLDSLDRIAEPQAWALGPRQPAPGASFARRVYTHVVDLERRHWREQDGLLGVGATAANLQPCWIGALAMTGDKARRNATSALRGLLASAAALPARTKAMAVVAAAQFEQDGAPWLPPLVEDLAPVAARAAAGLGAEEQLALGAAIDAVLFFVTGVRMATGPGVDEDWLRLRPRLPPGCRRVVVRGVRHDACTADLWLDRRTGIPTATEQEVLRRSDALERIAADAQSGDAQWLQGAVVVRSADAASTRCTVVHTPGRQFVARLRADDVLEFASSERSPLPTGSSGAPSAR